MYPAHIRNNPDGTKQVQSVDEHNKNVSKIAGDCLLSIGLAPAGRLAGLVHDMGKNTEESRRYQIDAADLASPSLEEVDDDELEAVSGGTEANDHHDVGCMFGLLWYADWDEANYKCCPHGQKQEGWLHFVQSYGYHTYKCVRCGYVFTNVEDGDVKDKFGFRSYLP